MKHVHSPSCKDLLGSISDFIDGDLDESVCLELQRHMAGCENCRVVFDTLTRTIYLYQADARVTSLPDGARERLFQTLHLDDLLGPKP